ncbi:hypothetical protein CHS0354_038051 [Potamilus streckersoni]|uniref:Zinc finger protein 830 n=1 Tax=Potamilus streckersoni TaxID=2493646 RepID=A0AAE0SSC0_9BIVA|nr:hypothetical protein CHS0354_038051 [Potamilus streckersoni]
MAVAKKKVVSKDDLRRLMKETKAARKSDSTKIDHPLAKYNNLGQLLCNICNTVIKSDLLWTVHIQSKQHKEKLASLKSTATAPDKTAGVKRKFSDTDSTISKRSKDVNDRDKSVNGLPADFFDKSGSKAFTGNHNKAPKPEHRSILAEYSSSDDEDDNDNENNENVHKREPHVKGANSNSALPADFFDSGVKPSTSSTADPESNIKKSTMAESLPEGFFDDPVMDAKVRKVEYINKQEEEWELFQRAMKEEAHVSEQIVEEEDEQVNINRNIDEIDDQMQRWREVDDLHNKREEIIQKAPANEQKESEDDAELNEADLEEFLDWRSKKLWR